MRSEIELASTQDERQEVLSRAAHLQREQQGRPSERQQVDEELGGDLAGPVHREDQHRAEDNKGYRRIRWSDVMSQDGAIPAPEAAGQRSSLEPGKQAPLVPAITRYQRSIEEVARERAMSVIEQQFDTVRSLVRRVFRDPVQVAARLRTAMTEKEGNGKIMAKAIAEQPERFGSCAASQVCSATTRNGRRRCNMPGLSPPMLAMSPRHGSAEVAKNARANNGGATTVM